MSRNELNIENLRMEYNVELDAVHAIERAITSLSEELYARENHLHKVVGYIFALGETP